MKWHTNPYRIVNKYGIVVQTQHFDVREEVLKSQENVLNPGFKFQRTSSSTLNAVEKHDLL